MFAVQRCSQHPLLLFLLAAVRYFGFNTDVDAVVYLMLVNNMIHDLFPTAITIGECQGSEIEPL